MPSLEFEPDETWRQKISTVARAQLRFCEVIKVVKDLLELPTTIPVYFKFQQARKQSYIRRNVDLNRREMMGYGGNSGSHEVDRFERVSPPNTFFG